MDTNSQTSETQTEDHTSSNPTLAQEHQAQPSTRTDRQSSSDSTSSSTSIQEIIHLSPTSSSTQHPDQLPAVVQSPSGISSREDNEESEKSSSSSQIMARRKIPNSPNAKSIEVTQLRAGEEFVPGTANQHPPLGSEACRSFRVGVSEDRNRKCRRTMEDSHSFLYSFGHLDGQGYFAVFDGHAGKHAAEWCGEWFHEYLLYELIHSSRSTPVPDLLNSTFHIVDKKLSQLAAKDGTHSGCTAVTALLRLEYSNGEPVGTVGAGVTESATSRVTNNNNNEEDFGHKESKALAEALNGTQRATEERQANLEGTDRESHNGTIKRTLYTANVGDARAVLCRDKKAIRLTYDHKGSDQREAQRIMDAGGFVMNNRVNGVLAVTRSLGDSSMKEFVVGSPYTTETTLDETDKFLIIACDGLWDVCEDQDAVDLIQDVKNPQVASQILLDHALSQFSTDNLSVMVISLRPSTFNI